MHKEKNLVVGLGEVGKALQAILLCDGEDSYKGISAPEKDYDVLHVAFPYGPDFIDHVQVYEKTFGTKLTIVHSSVPIGTCRQIGAVHSPVRGVHPELELGIRTFVKFFGGPRATEAAEIFSKRGIKTECTLHARDTEALKLWDTTQYGVMILLNKEIHKFCKENGLDFNLIYHAANKTYNQGYRKMRRWEVGRPYLDHMKGKIGGHCVVENAHLFDSESTRRIIEENGKL